MDKLLINNTKLLVLFLLGVVLSLTLSAQTSVDSTYQQWLYKKQRSTAFLNETYFFTGFGVGPVFAIPAIKTHIPFENGGIISEDIYGGLSMKLFINARAFAGLYYKRNYFTLQIENLYFYTNVSVWYKSYHDGSWNGSQHEKANTAPYVSFMYQYDVLNNNKKIALQPGLHLGVGIIGNYDKMFHNENAFYDPVSQVFTPEHKYMIKQETLQKVGFGFGPSLNFEVNFGRSFSLNLYQQLSYIAGPVLKTELWSEVIGDPIQYGMSKTSLLNYSANLALRFKMYLPKTRFKVAEKLSGK